MTFLGNSARSAILAAAIAVVPAAGAIAAVEDYELRLVTDQLRPGDGAMIGVRLVHRPTGRAVPDAAVEATRLDMSPDGMATMTMPLTPVPGGVAGVYRFRANLVMVGGYALTLTAKVQGEEGTLQQRLVLRAGS